MLTKITEAVRGVKETGFGYGEMDRDIEHEHEHEHDENR